MSWLIKNNVAQAAVKALGAQITLSVWGTSFGGGTVTIQGSPDAGTTWTTLQTIKGDPATFTAAVEVTLQPLAQGNMLRATLTGATNPSGVYAKTH